MSLSIFALIINNFLTLNIAVSMHLVYSNFTHTCNNRRMKLLCIYKTHMNINLLQFLRILHCKTDPFDILLTQKTFRFVISLPSSPLTQKMCMQVCMRCEKTRFYFCEQTSHQQHSAIWSHLAQSDKCKCGYDPRKFLIKAEKKRAELRERLERSRIRSESSKRYPDSMGNHC